MCDVIRQVEEMSRRSFLQRTGVAAGALSVAYGAERAAASTGESGRAEASRRNAENYRTRVVLLGTAAGRTWWGGSENQGISSAVAVGDAVYLVDFGDGWGRRYLQAGLGEQAALHGLERLRAAFITHLHSDHVVDYPNLFLFGTTDGLAGREQPVRIYGPGRRGSLPPVSGDPQDPPPVINPSNPMPGTHDMTEYLYQAYATDINDNMRDSLKPDPHTLLEVHDIEVPEGVVGDPNQDPAPDMAPFAVYEDDRVRVTATLVRHPPSYPTFGFRFDTDDGSVTFSGDTNVSENLIRLAADTDVLVHEVMDPQWVDSLFPTPPTPAQQAKKEHLLKSHTSIEDVGDVAERAGAGTLVLSHLAPADNPRRRWTEAGEGFSGRLVVGEDLVQVGVGTRRGRARRGS